MHATRPVRTPIRPFSIALTAAFGVVWASLPVAAQEKAAQETTVPTVRPSTPGVPSVSSPELSSLETSRALPILSRLADTNLVAGAYEFNDGADNELFGARAGVDMALTNRIFLEASYQHEPDMQMQNGFVGLWASIPLRDRKAPATTVATGPERTLASTLSGGGSPTRTRTSRKPEGAEARDGFFARLLPGSGRPEVDPPAAPVLTPVSGKPVPVAAPPAEQPAERGFFRELIHRVRN